MRETALEQGEDRVEIGQHALIFSYALGPTRGGTRAGVHAGSLLKWASECKPLPAVTPHGIACVADLQEQWTVAWHEAETVPSEDVFERLVEREHRANFDLWHEEDGARDPAATDSEIAAIKHAIDRLNQERNDLIEQMDTFLLWSCGEQRADAPLHSETPGMMLDRLSILALKLFHTRLEAERASATAEHRARNEERAALLLMQRTDLQVCLVGLLAEVVAGTRRFKLYRQLKMYNDPELNPSIYRLHAAQPADVGES